MDSKINVWEILLGILAVVASILVMACFFKLIATDHYVRNYYVGNYGTFDKGFCVSAEIDWLNDPIVFTSDDINKAISVTNELNRTLGGRR